MPTLRYERRLWNQGLERIVGVDEVGVAPTCGAVLAAAVVMRDGCHRIPGVRDSKTLSLLQRERLFPLIRRRAMTIGIGAASVAEIDRLNIYHATHLAMRRAVAKVGPHDHVLVDGRRIVGFEEHAGPYTAIIDGDAFCYSIACASIIAKVVRDRLMTKLAARYPDYGWEHNRGYSSPDHRVAIATHGITPHHRRSFATVRAALYGEQESLGLLTEEERIAIEEGIAAEERALAIDEPAPGLDPGELEAAIVEVETSLSPA
ncbi:MAG TPA: ribonuclease HII [Candidatus Limnocylindrales bacterium]|nr:ribonuclease HII [Candidatus Limnocylindrales bacterium]